jgi:hypothetical protein
LDLWAAVHRLPLREAADNLAATFHLLLPQTEKRNPSSEQPKEFKETKQFRQKPSVITPDAS